MEKARTSLPRRGVSPPFIGGNRAASQDFAILRKNGFDAMRLFGLAMPGEVRVFQNAELAAATRWISE